MNFTIYQFQEQLKESARLFAEKQVAPTVIKRDEERIWSPNIFEKMGEVGLLGSIFPTDYGGRNQSVFDYYLQIQGFAEGGLDVGLSQAWGTQVICGLLIEKFGNKEQKKKYIPQLCGGEKVGGYYLGDWEQGFKAQNLQMKAVNKGDYLLVNGVAKAIANGMQGDLFVVAAATENDTISTFIVETGLAGLRVDPSLARLGWKTCPIGDLYFEDYQVSQQNLFEVTDFKAILLLMQNWERFLSVAPWIGIMKALYDRSVTQAQNRELFGKRVATFSGIRAILANLRINYELCQHLADRAAWLMTQNSDQLLVEMAMTKVFIAEKAQKVARDAVQLHGSDGLLFSQHVERFYRDAMLLSILGGDSEITRSAIAQAIF